jgi:HTH-type transcriptional regulator/antitoxin HigA
MARKSYYEFKPDYAVAPGATVEEVLHSKEMTQADLSKRTGLATKTINEIIKGRAPITAETAIKFENVFGVKASFWLRLEANYQEDLARQKANQDIDSEIEISKACQYTDMARLGWVPETRQPEEKVRNLRQHFEVASLNRLEELPMVANFRRRHSDKTSFYALMAWIQKGRIEARKIETEPFSMKKLKDSIPELRSLTTRSVKESFIKIQEICQKSGVALIFIPHLKGTSANGATGWLSPDKAMIALSQRYPFEDVFWFSFFHEMGHILKGHSKKKLYSDNMREEDLILEKEANKIAADTLIPPQKFSEFKQQGYFYLDSIKSFAQEVGISPGIVAGRLGNENLLAWHSPIMQQTRQKFSFV